MTRLVTAFFVLAVCVLLTQTTSAQVNVYARPHTIAPVTPGIAWGEAIGGVDLDGDGKPEIYAVTTDLYDAAGELVPPRIYKYEFDGTSWNMVWSAIAPVEKQNTWPALTVGDLDGDGKMEVIWGPVNNIGTNLNPYRVLVYEVKGDGSDTLGVPDGLGNYLPNAKTTIVSTDNTNLRPFRWVVADMKGDGSKELVYASRSGVATFGILSVSDVPDNGDGSETWTHVITSSDSSSIAMTITGTVYDVAVMDSSAFFFSTSGQAQAVLYRNGAYKIMPPQANVVPVGSWKTSMVTDIDSNGTKEIVIASGANSDATVDNIYLLQMQADTLVGHIIGTADASVARLFGGAQGDLDGDGKVDFVFGSRNSNPIGQITRLSYLGGDITMSSSYALSTIDKGFGGGGERYDFLDMFNDGTKMNVMFGAGYGGDYDLPIVLLQTRALPAAPATIASIRTEDVNGVPDSLNKVVTVVGEVTSPNDMATTTQFYHFIQDGTAGILAFKSGLTAGTSPVYPRGDRIAVTGTITQFSGLTELAVSNLSTDIVDMGPNYHPVAPKVLTIDQYTSNGAAYEGQLIQFKGVAKKAGSLAWPAAGSSANMTIWDGYSSGTMRVSQYTQVDDSAEVTYPVNVTGIAVQNDGSSPYTSGYQIIPRLYSDFAQGVKTTVNAHFVLVTPADSSTVRVDSTNQKLKFSWQAAVDLDSDSSSYQWLPIGFTAQGSGHDTSYSIDGNTMLTYLGASDTVWVKWYVKAQDPASSTGGATTVTGVDTFVVRLIKNSTILSVPTNDLLPKEFALQQNFPNPFNPSTTIRVALPVASNITVRVYNLLGQEVTTVFEGYKNAGYVNLVWNGRDRNGMSVASGVYFYRIEAHGADGTSFEKIRKMMMLK